MLQYSTLRVVSNRKLDIVGILGSSIIIENSNFHINWKNQKQNYRNSEIITSYNILTKTMFYQYN